jgi:hypothetical protein
MYFTYSNNLLIVILIVLGIRKLYLSIYLSIYLSLSIYLILVIVVVICSNSNSNSNRNSVLFVLYLLHSMSTQHLFVHINMVVFRRVLIVHKLKMGVYLYQYYSVCTRNTEY